MLSKTQLKYIQSLGQKKFRDAEGLFIAEGPKLVADLLQNNHAVLHALYATQNWMDNNETLAEKTGAVVITDIELERISQLTTPNQVVAVFKKLNNQPQSSEGAVSLVLDTIQDPGNLGTIIRIADWFGVSQIVCSENCADMYNAKVVQATMGSIARVNVWYTNIAEWLAAQKISVYATVLNGTDISKTEKIKEGIIIIGNEANGISDEILSFATQKITIPKKGNAESLNAAVATGIILSHLT